MSYKWWKSTDTLLLDSLFNMVSREFLESRTLLWAHELEEGKCGRSRRGLFKQSCSCLEPMGSGVSRKGLQQEPCSICEAATAGTSPKTFPLQGEKGRERGMGQGDRDNHTSGVNCYKYQESNQYVKMCVPLFTYMRHVNEKWRERKEELERKRRDY